MANIAKQDRQSKMYSLVEKWQNSSSSKIEICRKNNVNIGTFNYWIKKYKKKNFSKFIELKPQNINSKTEANTIVKFKFAGNVSAEVPVELALKFMHQLASN